MGSLTRRFYGTTLFAVLALALAASPALGKSKNFLDSDDAKEANEPAKFLPDYDKLTKGKDADLIQLAAIDAGAEDVEVEPGLITVYTTPSSFERVKKALETGGIKTATAELSMRPTTTVRVEGEQARKVIGLVETLEELDDVQRVHANFDVPEEVLEHA